MYFTGPDGPVSPFHDIPLYANPEQTEVHMVVEIPRWTSAKMEISKSEPLNPIKQDVKRGCVRFVDSVFPYRGYLWNYGALPQTWEDPGHTDIRTGAAGDNDPLDVCEIGSRLSTRGSVLRVRPLGLLGLIDEGETDWKVLAIDTQDPIADKLQDVDDVQLYMPGLLEATLSWFRNYKVPQGGSPNRFAFEEEFRDAALAVEVIAETHRQWRAMMSRAVDPGGISCAHTGDSAEVGADRLTRRDAEAIVEAAPPPAPPYPMPESADRWHFV
uniref:inorganic diphosphatase n=1 Tax=Macrostomum lignano TaxID=282301 RepID=A0A1I8GJ40_9PLAT